MRHPIAGRTSRRRVIALLVAASMSLQLTCSPYRAIPLTRYEIPREVAPRPGDEPPSIRARFTNSPDWVTMQVHRIDGPHLIGVRTEGSPPEPRRQPVVIDIREVSEIEVYSHEARVWASIGRVAGITAGVTAAVFTVVALVALATKTSCPFVFVDTPTGTRFAGESYSGAVVRPLQRDDLLALPTPRDGTVHVTLSNHAYETQHTDRAELWVVDHASDLRAVASFDARPLLVGPARPPTAVRSLSGATLSAPSSQPGRWWETDMDAAATATNPALRDGLEVTFSAPSGDETAVLELDASNTPWLDLVLGRMYASFGDGLGEHLARADAQRDDRTQRAWRDREAIDLSVETMIDGRWQRVAVVPTPGPAALRSLAVPLPRGPSNEPVRVRLSAGTGFWRIGSLSLSSMRDATPTVARLTPTRAEQPDGSDARGLLSSTDGRYQDLARRGDRLLLDFEPPPASADSVRSTFLFANGYYTVQTPPQSERSTGTLLRLRDEPGAMARFSLDLYRELVRVIREAPRAP